MNEFQERLNELIDEKQISRLKLAKQLGITSTTINGYFNNDYFPQIDIAISMANFFGCSLDYLFGLSDERKSKYSSTCKNMLDNYIKNFIFQLKANNLSIAKAMRDLKMSEYNFYRWRNGKFPKTINIISVAKYFDVGVDYLLFND